MMLIAEKISKRIKGKPILTDIDLTLESGQIYGFTGENDSGKTMLFRALSGLMTVDSGRIMWGEGVLYQDFDVLPSLGIVLENAGLYPELTGYENLSVLASLKKQAGKEEIRQAIRRVGLDPADRRTYKKYSLGMKQRLSIAQAIMERPDILMLDEPTNALDAAGVQRIREIILEEKARGALILLASHNREDIQLLADKVFTLQDGHLAEGGQEL